MVKMAQDLGQTFMIQKNSLVQEQLRSKVDGQLETALLADGVAIADVYTVLEVKRE